MYRYNCKVTLSVDVETKAVLKVNGEHQHSNDLMKKKVRALEQEAIENASKNPTVSTRTVVGNLTSQVFFSLKSLNICKFNILL